MAINYVLDGQNYELNLIDTPGHVDFHYEVSRSLAACEGAILLVDATQGVQAQTVANAYAAINADLTIVPALNKIDMQASRPDEIREEIEATLGIDPSEVLAVSGKTGLGVPEIFRAIIDRVPHPPGDVQRAAPGADLRLEVRRLPGRGHLHPGHRRDLKVGQKIRLMAGGTEHDVINLGRFRPREVPCDDLGVGQVGYVTANIKQLSDVRIGDTITDAHRPADRGPARLPGAGAGRLLRPLPGHAQPVRGPPHRAPEALAQRRELHLRARVVRRPRLRLPVRVPGHAPHGDRPAAAGAREQPHALVQTAPNVTYEILTKRGETSTSPTRPASPTPATSRSSASPSRGSTSSSRPTASAP